MGEQGEGCAGTDTQTPLNAQSSGGFPSLLETLAHKGGSLGGRPPGYANTPRQGPHFSLSPAPRRLGASWPRHRGGGRAAISGGMPGSWECGRPPAAPAASMPTGTPASLARWQGGGWPPQPSLRSPRLPCCPAGLCQPPGAAGTAQRSQHRDVAAPAMGTGSAGPASARGFLIPLQAPPLQQVNTYARALLQGLQRATLQQELPARTNASAPTSPALTRDALHTKMEQLEEQLLSKILTLQKERQAASSDRSQQQHNIEKELNSLQNRVTELEHGPPTYSPPDAFKVTIPVQNNYMYARMKKTLPELYAFTICMWLKSKASGGLGTPFSYSVPGQANEIVLLEWGTNPLELLINDKVAQLPLSLKDKAWHHICVAWTTRDGKWAAYQDGEQQGASENLASWHAIKPQGVIILGQEQDTLGGRFDATQAFVGEIAQFGIWDHMLAPAEILAMANCTSHLQGNVIQWEDQAVEVFGGAGKASFAACEERMKA
uniref:Neuronal pentraxin receptor n=1 Tax=Dromaius novaehollandiae TaxID=8790 RepID=A0A8C4JKM9_DRONO